MSFAECAQGRCMLCVRMRQGRNGAQERTRTSTTLRPLAPEASASASSATWAQARKNEAESILRPGYWFVNEARACGCQIADDTSNCREVGGVRGCAGTR